MTSIDEFPAELAAEHYEPPQMSLVLSVLGRVRVDMTPGDPEHAPKVRIEFASAVLFIERDDALELCGQIRQALNG